MIHEGNVHLGVFSEYRVFKVMGLGEITKEVSVSRLKKEVMKQAWSTAMLRDHSSEKGPAKKTKKRSVGC